VSLYAFAKKIIPDRAAKGYAIESMTDGSVGAAVVFAGAAVAGASVVIP
jgi:hypothetical protein